MENVTLHGSHDEFNDFEYSMYSHKSIEKFVLTDLQAYEVQHKIPGIIKAIGKCPTLKVLELKSSKITEFTIPGTGIFSLCKSPTLRELRVTGFQLEEMAFGMVALLMTKTQLKVLALSKTNMGDEAIRRIAAKLSKSKLEHLDVSGNPISDVGAMAIASALSDNTSLRVLSLSGCKQILVEGLQALDAMAENNSSLERLETPFVGNHACMGGDDASLSAQQSRQAAWAA
jgi:Leucine-rich repeat (LRR) protein